jgi:hypothetical protein
MVTALIYPGRLVFMSRVTFIYVVSSAHCFTTMYLQALEVSVNGMILFSC